MQMGIQWQACMVHPHIYMLSVAAQTHMVRNAQEVHTVTLAAQEKQVTFTVYSRVEPLVAVLVQRIGPSCTAAYLAPSHLPSTLAFIVPIKFSPAREEQIQIKSRIIHIQEKDGIRFDDSYAKKFFSHPHCFNLDHHLCFFYSLVEQSLVPRVDHVLHFDALAAKKPVVVGLGEAVVEFVCGGGGSAGFSDRTALSFRVLE
ncbi:hypothetical protein Syun_007017 [Stephania yunnanensis]|uniref:Uncharacterized protein n=1 Tax=Stephania yunnanensis TaxID=152371 RepID=A0AAP0Q1Z3_9MAGN